MWMKNEMVSRPNNGGSNYTRGDYRGGKDTSGGRGAFINNRGGNDNWQNGQNQGNNYRGNNNREGFKK